MIELECDICGYKSYDCSDFTSGMNVGRKENCICVDCANDLQKRDYRTYYEKIKEIGG